MASTETHQSIYDRRRRLLKSRDQLGVDARNNWALWRARLQPFAEAMFKARAEGRMQSFMQDMGVG